MTAHIILVVTLDLVFPIAGVVFENTFEVLHVVKNAFAGPLLAYIGIGFANAAIRRRLQRRHLLPAAQ